MAEIRELIRPHLLNLKPYASARDDYSGKEGVFLDANENSFGSATDSFYNRYPDPYQRALKAKIARMKRVNADQVFLGNGSDEAIDLLIRLFCEPTKDNIVILPPTYGMYKVSASIHNVGVKEVQLTKDYQIDVDGVLNALNPNSKMIWICSPNNPTGNLIKQELIEEVLHNFGGIVVIDEAYQDFVKSTSWIRRLEEFPNLVVLQTFSKAWGLASLRLGMAFAAPELIGWFNKIKPPYNIPEPTQEIALQALDNLDNVKAMIANIVLFREMLKEKLKDLTCVQKIYPSDANFLLVRFKNASATFQHLLDQKVIVRNRSNVVLCDDCLRITVGTRQENERLISALRKLT